MKKISIKLSTIEDVRKFVETVTAYDMDIDLASGRYIVDAKSIMGIFSLDLLKPIELTAYSDNTDALFADLAPFIVK